MARRIAVAALLAAVACSQTKTDTVTVPSPDRTPPLVLFASPAADATSVPLNVHVSATFSETMDPVSLASALSLVGPSGPVAGNLAVSLDARTVTFSPGAALDPASLYTASTSSGATDAAGNHLAAPAMWSFRTGAAPDLTPPAVVSVSPAAGSLAAAATTPTVSATFSEPIDCARLPAGALALFEGDVPVPGYVDCSGAVLEFIPVPALPTLTSLIAVVSPLVLDVAGNPLGTARVWQFDVLPWTRQLGSVTNDLALSVALDAAGNVLVAGYTLGGLDGNTNAGGYDLFVVKYDPSGAKLWTRQLGSPQADYGYSVATDATGNVFVAGYTSGDLDGNTSAGGDDLFVVKYDPSGAKLWTRQLGSPQDDFGFGVAADEAGNVLIGGWTEGGLDGNTNAGGRDLFVVKYDPSGAKLWTRQLGSPQDDQGLGVATDVVGNVLVTGSTSGNLDGNTSAGGPGLFVVKYDSSGTNLWTRQLGSSDEMGWGVATDAAGNVLVTGAAGVVLFTVKYDPSGEKLWSRQLGSWDIGHSVAADAAGNVFVAGYGLLGIEDGSPNAGLMHDGFVVKYGPDGRKR